MNGQGPLSFEATINDSNYQSRLNAMERRVLGFTNTAVQQANRFESAFQNLGRLAVGAFAFTQLAQLPQELLQVRGEFQQLEIAFTTMLRSKSKADAFLKEGVAFAATSPFSLKDIGTGQKQLLAYGFSVDEIIPSLKRLGDISAGLGLPLERLTYLYGTTKTQGRLFAQDLNQFVGSGIPLIGELAKQFGVTEDKVRKLVEEGKVGFAEVKKAIESMTTGSGIFAGTLDAQSKSLLGLKEKLGDAYAAMLNEIGKQNEGLIADLINTATDVVQNYQKVIDIVVVLVASYGAYKAATVLASVAQLAQIPITEAQAIAQAQAANAMGFLTLSQTRAAASTALLTRAQAALNGVMNINPVILIGTALAALATAYFVFREETVKIKTAQELLSESTKQTLANFRQQSGEVQNLIGVIKNQNIAESERIKAYDRLKAIAPDIVRGLDFQRAKTADLTQELNLYLVSLEKKIRLESASSALRTAYEQDTEAAEKLKKAQEDLVTTSKKASANNLLGVGVITASGASGATSYMDQANKELAQAYEQKRKTKNVVDEINRAITGIYTGGSKDGINAEIARLELVQSTIKNKLTPAYKQVEDQINDLVKQRDSLTQAETKGAVVTGKTIEQLKEEIKLKKESLSTANSDATNAKIRKDIADLEAQERKLAGQKNKAERDADKVGPYGSLSYWDSVATKAKEIRDKTPDANTAKIARQNAIILNAEQKAEELRKKYAIRSFDEELADKKSKYELYQKWVDAYGKVSADSQFDTLLKNGESYIDFLNSEIAKLETQKSSGKLNEKDTKNLGSLITQRDEVTGKKSAIDLFNESLQTAQVEAKSLSGYLAVLKEKQDELNQTPPKTVDDFAKRRQVAEEITRTQQQLKQQLDQYLTDFAGSEQQQLAIRTKYTELRTALDTKYLNNRNSEYKAALDILNSDEEKAIQDFQQHQLEQTKAYKDTTKVILEQGEKRTEIEIAQQRKVVDEAKKIAGVTSEVYKAALAKLNELIEKNGGTPAQKLLAKYANVFNAFGQSLSQLGGDAAKAGEILSGLANNLALVGQVLDKNTTKNQKYAIAIQGLVQLFGTIASAAASRKKAETDYYNSLIAQQQQYNILLNEQLGIQAKSRENIFVKDYTGELRDAFAQFDDAQIKYQESLKKLNEGRAKSGLKDYFDASNALSLIGSGAATGAAIGSIVPVVGTAVGAVAGAIVGGIVGLFSSNKKVDEFGNLLGLYPDLIKKSANGVDELNTALAESLIAQGLVDDQTKILLQSTIDWQKQIDAAREAIKGIVSDLAGALGDNLRNNLVSAFKDGADAAKVFSDSVSQILEDLVTKMLFSKAFNAEFDKLEKDLTASLDTSSGGDGNTIDDFQRFTENSKASLEQYNLWLQQFQDAAKASGFDVLKPTTGNTSANTNSLQGAIKGITEETASVLVGQSNAQRILTADTNALIRQQLLSLSGIEQNTARIQRTNELLDSVDRRLKTISESSTRGLGGPL